MAYTINELTGQQFGYLLVLYKHDERTEDGRVQWVCLCECGDFTIKTSQLLHRGKPSCGCLSHSDRTPNLTNKKFGRLLVIDKNYEHSMRTGETCWNCLCECGNTISVLADSLQNHRTRSCGCYNNEMRRARTGEKNPSWRGGVTPDNLLARSSADYKDWRLAVFTRDNFTCTSCGKTNTRLNAHHIKPFSTHPDLRTDVDNGITLCESCHLEVHKKNC